MKRFCIYFLGLLCLLSLFSCRKGGKIIPEAKMTEIYADMFLEDQWLVTFRKYRLMADTTLFYDPIFEKHGYDFEDFSRSVDYYVDHPEKYIKLLRKTEDLLAKRREPFAEEVERQKKYMLGIVNAHYKRVDFSVDSVKWKFLDTLMTVKPYVEGTDSLWTDKEPAPGKFARPEFAARER